MIENGGNENKSRQRGGGGSKVQALSLGHRALSRFFTPAKLKIQELRDGRHRHGRRPWSQTQADGQEKARRQPRQESAE
ncbi:hypothetical protein METHP14_820035 [Pseudomonas sp. P14-2025]